MSKLTEVEIVQFERAASAINVHGILSIVFGGLGALSILFFAGLFGILAATDTMTPDDIVGYSIMGLLSFVFFLIPHVYLIIAGIYLLKKPDPKVAKALIIINIVIGACWNLILVIFAIINLTQISDYARGYVKPRHAHEPKAVA